MKIVHVVQWLALGGGESVAVDLATRQRRSGHRVRVVALQGAASPLVGRLQTAGVPLDVVPRLRKGLDPSLWPALWARFARGRPDVVHSHDPKSLVFGAPAARLVGARTVHTKHGVDVDTQRRRRLVQVASRALDVCVAVSDETATLAQRECFGVPVRVIENGIEVDRERLSREQARVALGLPADAWVIGAIGRLEPVKGHATLIEAARPLLDAGAHLCIVGDGSLRGHLPDHPNLHLPGLIPDAAGLLLAFDVFAQPSLSEGLPLAVLEAMAAARPIVASAVGQMPHILGEVGVVVPPADGDALQRALGELREMAHPGRLGDAARSKVCRDHSLSATVSAYDAVYQG